MNKGVGALVNFNWANFSLAMFWRLAAAGACASAVLASLPDARAQATSSTPPAPIASPDPASVSLPCVGSGAQAQFGQRECSYVLPNVINQINSKFGTMVSYYKNDGAMIEFMDTDGVSATGPDVAPFCVARTFSGPVCELPKGDDAQHCAIPAPTIVTTSSSDSACFGSNPPNLQVCGQSRYNVAISEIQAVNSLAQGLRDELAATPNTPANKTTIQQIHAQLDPLESALSDPSVMSQKIQEQWANFKAPSQFCRFTANGLDMSSCGVELAWLRGFMVSYWDFYRRQVLDEIGAGSLNVHRFAGTAYCGQLASNYVAATKQIDDAQALIASSFGQTNQALNTSTNEACLESQTDLAGRSIANLQSTRSQDVNPLVAWLESTFLKPNTQNQNGALQKHVSQSVCNLAVARAQTISLFSKLAFCEISSRAREQYYQMYLSTPGYFAQFKNQLVDKCVNFAKSEVATSIFDTSKCHSENCVVNERFYPCYQGKNPDYARRAGTQGVQAFFQSLYDSSAIYDQDGSPTGSRLPASSADMPNQKTIVHSNGQPFAVSELPKCATTH